jgi:heme-degrading monooxygenase HmoA
MQNIITIISFKLVNNDLLEGWKKTSAHITESLKKVDGFIYRDSAISEDGTVYCILKWESAEKQQAFRKVMESDDFKKENEGFMDIVDMKTMKSETLQVL